METIKKLAGEEIEEETEIRYIKPRNFGETFSITPSTRKNDPFFTVHTEGLVKSEKQRISRLRKQAPKNDATSKAKDPEQLSSYDVYKLVPPPYDLDSLAKLYEMNAAHNAAVTQKAINICGLGWELVENPKTMLKIEQAQEKKEKNKALNQELKKERIKVMEIISALNEEEEFGEIMVKIWTDVESMGNGYLEIGRNRDGTIGYLGHIPANTIRIRTARDGFMQIAGDKYVFFRNYKDEEAANPLKNDPNPNEIFHFKKYSPHSTYYGIPDIVAAMAAIAGDRLSKDYNLEYFENKAVPRYAFITKGVRLSEEAQQALQQFFTNELKGKHHGTLYIPLPASINQNVDAKFEAIEVRPQEQSFYEFIKECRLEVLIVHRVPPSKVGVYEHTNLAVSRDADKTFKEQVCRPEQRRIEKKLNMILKEFTDSFYLKFEEADIIDADVKSRMFDRYLRTKVVTPNEVRREIGLPSDTDGDDFLPYPPQAGLPQAQGIPGAPPKTSPSKTPAAANETGTRKERGQNLDQGASPRPSRP